MFNSSHKGLRNTNINQTYKSLGFMSAAERKAMEAIVSPHGKYWLPIHWSFHIIKKARLDGIIKTDRGVELVQDVSG